MDNREQRFDVAVVGAGAAGLMCAATAAARGRRVVLLDGNEGAGAKILISGGGRCNFTNEHVEPDRFISANPRFAASALGRYAASDFVDLVRRHGIAFHEKTLGQLFCDGSARQIVDMLLAECARGGVVLRFGARATAANAAADGFRVETERGPVDASRLVLATGGLSIPKLGASPFAFRAAEAFGLPVVPPRPGLVPLRFEGDDLETMRPLAGVALPAVARAGRAAFAEAMLFTHRGLSGPAVLQASSYLGGTLELDMMPGRDAAAALIDGKTRRARAEPRTVLAEWLPARLAASLAARLPAAPMAEQKDKALRALGALLNRWVLTPSGTEGYAKAEVTLGGIDTRALSSRTMEARTVPGLFAVGEAVDVTGWLGGYNFQWAWSSGWCAGQAA